MHNFDQFLQSNEWKEFQETLGHTVIEGDGFFAVEKKMQLGLKNLYVGRADLSQDQIAWLEEEGRKRGVDFLRIDSVSVDYTNVGFTEVGETQPKHTLILDLTLSEDELLAQMHQKTRYNIRLARKKGVTTRIINLDECEIFWDLISQTYSRKGITAHTKQYYKTLIQNHPYAYISLAEVDGKPAAANLMLRHGNTVTYLHGGTDNSLKQYMAPHLLQWTEIMRAKLDGFAYYDFWGIAPDDDPKHPWAGVTRFKKGFGGITVTFPGTFEKGVSWKYPLYKIVRKFR